MNKGSTKKKLWGWFRQRGQYPCRSVNTEESRACPRAGWRGCRGRYSQCDEEYVRKSEEFVSLQNSCPSTKMRSYSMREMFFGDSNEP